MPSIELLIMIASASVLIAVMYKVVFEKRVFVEYVFSDATVYRTDGCEFIEHQNYETSKQFDQRVYLKKQTGFSNAVEFSGLHQDGVVSIGERTIIKGQMIGREMESGALFIMDKKAFECVYKRAAKPPYSQETRQAS